MRLEILGCLKRERDICVKTIITSQNTAFMWTPALRERIQGHSSCSYCQANRCKENHKCNASVKIRNERRWRYRTKISLAPKRGCLPKGKQRAFHLLLKVSRIEEMLEAPRAGGPVRVGLCRDSAPVNSTL